MSKTTVKNADQLEAENGELRLIPVNKIRPSPLNPRKRFDEAELQGLAASIRAKGVLEPILLRPGTRPHDKEYELVAGERRWRAARLAGLTVIPAIVRQLDHKQVLEIMVIENEQRSDTTPLEKSAGYRSLVQQHGYTVKDLAAKVGKSEATIYGLLKLADLPDRAKFFLAEGKLPVMSAQLIARIPDAAAREEFAKTATMPQGYGDNKELPSFRWLKQEIERRFMVELKRAPFRQDDKDLHPEAGSCTDCPKRTGNARELYPDSRTDVCTDPACYRRKVELHTERVMFQAKQLGKKILSGKEAEKLFPRGDGDLSYSAAYVDLKDQCWQDQKRRSYKQLVEKELEDEIVLAVDGQGTLHRLVPKDAANKVLRDKKILKAGGNADIDRSGAYRREQARQKQKAAAGAAAAKQAIGIVADKIERAAGGIAGWSPALLAMLKAVALAMTQTLWNDACRRVVQRRKLDATTSDQRTPGAELIAAPETRAPQVLGIIAELVAARESFEWSNAYHNVRDDDAVAAFFRAFGIEPKRLLDQAAKATGGKKKGAGD